MSSSNTIDFNYPTFNQLDQQKKSRLVAGLLLILVLVLHTTVAFYLLNAPKKEHNKLPVTIEVVMLPSPKPIVQQVAKEPPPAPPVKKTPIKPKSVVKPPEPVKKPVVVKKPAPLPAPKPKPEPKEIKEVIPVPKFEPVPTRVSAPPLVAPAPARASAASSSASSKVGAASKTTGHGRDDSKTVVSGVVPLVRVPPRYPTRAASRQIEGWVKVEFTIQTDGSVANAVVVGSEPEAIFDDAALTAISKWKFKEKIVNGVAVPQRAVQQLQFKLKQ